MKQEDIIKFIKSQRLRWAPHVMRMENRVEAQDETRGYNKIYKITKTEMGSPCNENGEYMNYQKNNRMDAI